MLPLNVNEDETRRTGESGMIGVSFGREYELHGGDENTSLVLVALQWRPTLSKRDCYVTP